jgi:hypothetical protein
VEHEAQEWKNGAPSFGKRSMCPIRGLIAFIVRALMSAVAGQRRKASTATGQIAPPTAVPVQAVTSGDAIADPRPPHQARLAPLLHCDSSDAARREPICRHVDLSAVGFPFADNASISKAVS